MPDQLSAATEQSALDFGVSAVSLDRTPCVCEHFLRAGGEDAPVTPTRVAVVCTETALSVSFDFAEPSRHYRPVSRGVGLANPAFQDSVGVQIRPDWSTTEVYWIAVASSGENFGLRYGSLPLPEDTLPETIDGYQVEFSGMNTQRRRARIELPWTIFGGKPRETFGLNLLRTRMQSGEVLSPVALDHTRELAPDLFMEAALCQPGQQPQALTLPGMLTTLPSGKRRWQRPARLVWPAHGEREAIARLQNEVHEVATTPELLAERVHLCQRWLDLLTLEGFSFHTEGGCWSIGTGEFRPEQARAAVNEALRRDDPAAACNVLDTFLAQLDRATSNWFADGTPGDIADGWLPVTHIGRIACDEQTVHLTASADGRAVRLHIRSPQPGCVRLHADAHGFFNAPPAVPLSWTRHADGVDARFGECTVQVRTAPWSIVLLDGAGNERWRLGAGDLAFRFDAHHELEAVELCAALEADEALYGFGERFDAVNQRGRILTVHDLDAWEGAIYGLRNQQYKPIQLFHSTAGYTLFLDNTGRLRVDAGNTRADRLRLTQRGSAFDLYAWACTPLEALDGYTRITGRPILPPKWAFEPWMGGGWGRWKNGPLGDPALEMLNVVRQFRDLDIPHAALYAEGEASDDPRLFNGLEPQGIRPFAWMNSTMGERTQKSLLPGVPEDDLPMLKQAGGGFFPYVDFTHPKAPEMLRAFWKRRLDLGIAGSMVDFGDLVPDDAVFHDGRQGPELHNHYAYDYHRLYRDAFAERRGSDHILYSRSAAPGSQRWLCQFAGDHQPNAVGMRAALYGGLNLAACGFSTWGGDIGGYLGWPDPETYIRWVQVGCFSPLMRCHGTEPREPWEYGQEAVQIYRFYAWLRENLLEYIYRAAVEAHEQGGPIMRLPALAFPDDPEAANCDDQYMFGPDILVAPVLPGTTRREVTMPAGRWVDFWNGNVVNGPRRLTTEAPLNRIPLYLRGSALFPAALDADRQWGTSMTAGRIQAAVATPQEAGDFALHLDWPEVRYLLLYGAEAAAIEVNGQKLPEAAAADFSASGPAWQREAARITVRLPEGLCRHISVRCENGE